MTSPTIGVLALQGDVPEHLAALDDAGARPVRVRRPAELAVDGLIIPGGESTTMARLLGAFDLLDGLRARIGEGLAVYGSCAGMVLLADRVIGAAGPVLGGMDVTVRRNAFGRQVDSFEEELSAPGLGAAHEPLRAVYIRAPWVEEAGDGVEVLARVRTGPAAGRIVAARQGALLATAFHPEISGDARVHRVFLDMVRATTDLSTAVPAGRHRS